VIAKMPLVWNTMVTLGSPTNRFNETTPADEVNEEDMAFQFNPHPWMKKVLEFATDEEGNVRHIMWAYSIMGKVGKSVLTDHMVKNMNALKVDAREPKRVKHAILAKIDKDKTFLDNPIIVVDLPRQESSLAKNKNFYVSLEEIQSNFHSTMYRGGQVVWKVPPKVIVFTTCQPDPNMLCPDRLQTYVIKPDTMDLERDSEIDAQLAAQAQEFKRLQKEREIAISNAPGIDLIDTKTCFELCFSLSTSTPALLAEKLHHSMRRAGYNQSKKVMNLWIREHFEQEIKAGVVREINQSNRVAWKGFKPRSPQI